METRSAWIAAGGTVVAALVAAVVTVSFGPPGGGQPSTTPPPPPVTTSQPPSTTPTSPPLPPPAANEVIWSGELRVDSGGVDFSKGNPDPQGGTRNTFAPENGVFYEGIIGGRKTWAPWIEDTDPNFEQCAETVLVNSRSDGDGLSASPGSAYCIEIDNSNGNSVMLFGRVLSTDGEDAVRMTVTTWRMAT